MIKRLLKYFYLTLGLVYYGWVNYLSYTKEPYLSSQSLTIKIIFSVISIIVLWIIYILLIYPKLITKNKLKKETIIMMYIAVIIVPLISLTN